MGITGGKRKSYRECHCDALAKHNQLQKETPGQIFENNTAIPKVLEILWFTSGKKEKYNRKTGS